MSFQKQLLETQEQTAALMKSAPNQSLIHNTDHTPVIKHHNVDFKHTPVIKQPTNQFMFNQTASYKPGGVYQKKSLELINVDIQVSENKSFHVIFPNVFENYKLPLVKSTEIIHDWQTNWINFWQNQLNFAVWCATSGCGVDYQNHLQSKDPIIRSLFKFHVYYQIRRILFEMNDALPQDKSWNAFDSSFNQKAYEQICDEFKVNKNSDWRQKVSDNDGIGTMYNYWTYNGYHPVPYPYDPNRFSFERGKANHVHIDYLAQGKEAIDGWTTLIVDNANGFTAAGVERINDSIRTYCWAILGSQSQTRTSIIGTGTAFDAQKQFLANIEDAIQSPVDLPSQIARFQNTLKYARSKVDFVFGIGLYMAPGDMDLRIGNIQDYNNEIVVATSSQSLGLNDDVNNIIPKQVTTTVGTPTIKHGIPDPKLTDTTPDLTTEHDNNKTALIVGAIAIGLTGILFYEILLQ